MDENSYAANGIKHCIRPCDMTGKSAALIMRQMHHKVVVFLNKSKKNEAVKYDNYVDLPTWMSTLSINPDSVQYVDQKRMEAEELLKQNGGCQLQKNN